MAKPSQQQQQGTTAETPGHDGVDLPAHCPAAWAMELVAHKWTIHIVFALHNAGGPARFRQLQRTVAPISQTELTKRLRDLERSGLVHRRAFAEVPPRVEYRLTTLGLTLIPALTGLHEWAVQHGPAVAEHWHRPAAGATDQPEAESAHSARSAPDQ